MFRLLIGEAIGSNLPFELSVESPHAGSAIYRAFNFTGLSRTR